MNKSRDVMIDAQPHDTGATKILEIYLKSSLDFYISIIWIHIYRLLNQALAVTYLWTEKVIPSQCIFIYDIY